MTDTLPVKLKNSNPQFALKPSTPAELPITMSKGIQLPAVQYNFTWNQAIPLSVWTIPHNLNKFPSISVCDTLGNIIYPDIKYIDSNIVQIIHGSAFAGKAYLN